jgi:hypothetical protein
MQLTALSKHDQNNQNYTLQFARMEQYEGHAAYAWQLALEPGSHSLHYFREVRCALLGARASPPIAFGLSITAAQ